MRLFLDSANLADIQWALGAGLIDGVSTNPSLLAEALSDDDPLAHLLEICRLVRGPVTAQVISTDADGMYREARELARAGDNIVVEVPIGEEGLVVTRRLSSEGVRVNVTLIFSAVQALLAARSGAAWVSPFVGRVDDGGGDGAELVADIRRIFDNYGLESEILAASIRNPRRLVDAARLGADAAAVPPTVLRSVLVHPLTDAGLRQFRSDWSRRLAKTRVGV